jgi:chaperonin cofactor prefoldin
MSFHNQEEEPYYLEQKVSKLKSRLDKNEQVYNNNMRMLFEKLESMQKEIDELQEKLSGR